MAGIKNGTPVDGATIQQMLKRKKQMKTLLSFCASCAICAKSCFLYKKHEQPEYTPSYKAIFSLGKLFKKKGKVTRGELEEMGALLFGKCVLCGRCYCPFGIDISSMLAWARTICRMQGVHERYDVDAMGIPVKGDLE
jgi:L-lactate utilization protein LutB